MRKRTPTTLRSTIRTTWLGTSVPKTIQPVRTKLRTMTWTTTTTRSTTVMTMISTMMTSTRTGARALRLRARPGLVVLLLTVAGLLATPIVSAQAVEVAHSYTFGQAARFTLTLPNDRTAKQATFYLQTNDDRTAGFDTLMTGDRAEVTRSLVSEPLPPYARLTYWWSYLDDAGILVETDKVRFDYVDNRYAWQLAEGDGVVVHWVAGERSLMVQAVDVAETALTRFGEALATERAESTDIYIYPSQSDLASAMQLAGFDWAGGVAYPELGVVLVAIPPSVEAPVAMQQDIPHELTHRALFDWLGAPGYASLPTWLDEGLAMAFEARPDPLRALVLQDAQRANTLIPLTELCVPFPDDPDRAQLAYAQSERIVAYLRQTYGWSGLRSLILAYADGKACDAGMQEGLGQSLAAVDRAWQITAEQSQQPAATSGARAGASLLWRDAAPWLILLAVVLLPGLALVVARRD